MRMRQLGRSGLMVSEVGLGAEHLQSKPYAVVREVIDAALEADINMMDVFMSEPQVRTNIGMALDGRREKMILQGHIGAAWKDGQYCRTRDVAEAEEAFADFLERIGTDYVDIGMIHFVDTQEDFEATFHGPLVEYAKFLKEQGIIRAIGMSSHNPAVALQAVETGVLDVLMFSLNPAYDLLPEDTEIDALFKDESFRREGLLGVNPVRDRLYRTCEAMGVGITVMKGLGAGVLLNERSSPFRKALSPAQCIHYALTRPAVGSVLVGCRSGEEVRAAAAYETATDAERDYSFILGETAAYSMTGQCMYCNHCLPCPVGMDVAAVNKYLDMVTTLGEIPATVAAHYDALSAHAGDCLGCGACEERCPFRVKVIGRMAKAREIFGK